METHNNRKFFRVQCKIPICTQMSIVKVDNREVNTGTGHICVEDIGAGGLKFLSGLNLPVSDMLVIEFKLEIAEELIAFYGYIVRKEDLEHDIHRYGVKFIKDAAENQQSVRILNELNKEGVLNSSSFCSGHVVECLKKHKFKNNRRSYKRYKFSDNFTAKMHVVTINNKAVSSQWEEILVNDISIGGIQFTSNLELPAIDDVVLEFKINISNREIDVKGSVVRREEIGEGKYRYGIKFHLSNSREKIISEILKSVLNFSLETGLYKRKYLAVKFNQRLPKSENLEWWG